MSDRSVVAKAAAQLRPGDTVSVHVIYAGGPNRISRFNWKVEMHCNRLVWKNPGVRGGLSSIFFIGHCRSQESAARRAEKIVRMLTAARTMERAAQVR